jgi:hypothetical protein
LSNHSRVRNARKWRPRPWNEQSRLQTQT